MTPTFAELLRLREAATQGEWEVRENVPYSIDGRVIFTGRWDSNKTIARFPESMRAFPESLANIEFICFAANNSVTMLAEEREHADRLAEALKGWHGVACVKCAGICEASSLLAAHTARRGSKP